MSTSDPIDLAVLRFADFEPHLDSCFMIPVEGGEAVILKLLSGSEYPQRQGAAESAARRPFSLVFLCDTMVVPPFTYRLEHAVLGTLDLFLSPFEAAGSGCRLEAIFN